MLAKYMEQRTYANVRHLSLYHQLSVNVTQITRIDDACLRTKMKLSYSFTRLRKQLSDLNRTISVIQYV